MITSTTQRLASRSRPSCTVRSDVAPALAQGVRQEIGQHDDEGVAARAVLVAQFAKAKEPFLRGFLTLANGLPSHDTFSRLFRQLDPEQFRAVFQRFMSRFSIPCQGVIAIDGKVLRRSFDKASGKSPLHMVSAWGCQQRMVLAQIATEAKSNEITAVPKLLEMLSLKGTIVTVDALNCQR